MEPFTSPVALNRWSHEALPGDIFQVKVMVLEEL